MIFEIESLILKPSLAIATFCYARYLSRTDSVVDETVFKTCDEITSEMEKADFSLKSVRFLSGSLTFLSNLYKIGDRNKLRPINEKVFSVVEAILEMVDDLEEAQKDSHIQKLLTKLAGRIALVELKPRKASWKYNRGGRKGINNYFSNFPQIMQILDK